MAHPNSIAALHAFRWPIQDTPKCKHCRRLALRGRGLCQWHAGRNYRGSDAGGRAERRTLLALDRLGVLPGELLATDTWRGLGTLGTAVRSPVRLRLVLLWHERERQPLAWSAAWREATRQAHQARQACQVERVGWGTA